MVTLVSASRDAGEQAPDSPTAYLSEGVRKSFYGEQCSYAREAVSYNICPQCGESTTNVQGVAVCSNCGWTVDPTRP